MSAAHQSCCQPLRVVAQLERRRCFPVIGAQHRTQIEEPWTRPAFAIEHGTVRSGAQAQPEFVRHGETVLAQLAPERIIETPQVEIGPRAVDDAVDEQLFCSTEPRGRSVT